MNCPTVDKISQYEDNLLTNDEQVQIERHIQSCVACAEVAKAFKKEQVFIKDTLQMPTLPDNFNSLVLDQLEPYPKQQKPRRSTPWKRVMLTAAGIVFAVGLSATFHPSFAQLIGGMFSSNQVDEGLQVAAEAGLTQRVDLAVEDQGLTLKVEDVIADSSRVTLSYQVLKDGKPQDTYLELAESDNAITAVDQHGNALNRLGTGWQEGSAYGIVEFSLRGQENLEKLTIQFDLVELNGVKGNWQLEVPVDLQETQKLTKTVDLNESIPSHHGVVVDLKKLQIAPSSTEFMYETSFTQEELAIAEQTRNQFEKDFGAKHLDSLVYGVDSAIAYHVENADGQTIYATSNPMGADTIGMLQSSGEDTAEIGKTVWNDSFVPSKEDNLSFVLDGVYKKEPANFSLTVRPSELKKQPISFDYKGNHLTITKVKKKNEYSFKKSLNPIQKETSVVISLEGGKDAQSSDLGSWLVVDEKGNVYPGNPSGSVLNKTDKNGRFITTIELELEGLEEVPEQLTLHLVSTTQYYPVENATKVPLLEQK